LVTKTFLIFTVFALRTDWLGVGVGRGAVITAVHTLVVKIYYWTFSPIGLPSSPDSRDLEGTWCDGPSDPLWRHPRTRLRARSIAVRNTSASELSGPATGASTVEVAIPLRDLRRMTGESRLWARPRTGDLQRLRDRRPSAIRVRDEHVTG
jgi:hypothetical protein